MSEALALRMFRTSCALLQEGLRREQQVPSPEGLQQVIEGYSLLTSLLEKTLTVISSRSEVGYQDEPFAAEVRDHLANAEQLLDLQAQAQRAIPATPAVRSHLDMEGLENAGATAERLRKVLRAVLGVAAAGTAGLTAPVGQLESPRETETMKSALARLCAGGMY